MLANDDVIRDKCAPYCPPGSPKGDDCPLGNAAACYLDQVETAVIHMSFDLTQIVIHEAAHRLMFCAGFGYYDSVGHDLEPVWGMDGIVASTQREFE